MDLETTEAIGTLRVDVQDVSGRVDHLSQRVDRLTEKVDVGHASLSSEIGRVESSLWSEIRRVESSLRAEMQELHNDAKRHADIIGESLHDDIRLLAEAVVSLTEKIDQRRL
jgi:hypothetical protein